MKQWVVRMAGLRTFVLLGLMGLLFGVASAPAGARRSPHAKKHCVSQRRHHKKGGCTRSRRHHRTRKHHGPSHPGATGSAGGASSAGGTTSPGTSGSGSPAAGGSNSGTGGSNFGSGGGNSGSGTPTGSGGTASSASTVGNFSYGQLQDQTVGARGCGTNSAGEPAIHVSRAGNVFLGSELGVGSGTELWRGLGLSGGPGASGCGLEFRGQPNALTTGVGASGGDIDVAIASAINPSTGNYNLYVSSLNLGSVNVATSTDNATTFSQTPVQGGLPLDDREWIAAFGADTSLLTYHDIATNNIDVLRSDNDGALYAQIARVIPDTDYKGQNNELGNLVIDHRNLPDSAGDFYAYQSFVAPSSASGSNYNEAFLGVSADGGHTWTDRPIPCSVSSNGLDHNFPNVSVAPNGNIWYAWSDDHNVYTAKSTDHGATWTCSRRVSTNTAQAIFPWLAATSSGVDLVYYGAPTTSNQTWYVYFAQNLAGWGTPQRLMAVHQGPVCESGINCTGGRQLFDDFGVDTDSSGWAHIAYSHDSPNLGGSETYTGYAVQTAGTRAGYPDN